MSANSSFTHRTRLDCASLLITLSYLPLVDLVHSSRVCHDWYDWISSDSLELAWMAQRQQERRKYRLTMKRIDSSTQEYIPHTYDYGEFRPEPELCRAVLLRATPNAYFLRHAQKMMEEEAIKRGQVEEDYKIKLASSMVPPLPVLSTTPLLFHLRSLSLSLHCTFPRVYVYFLTSFLHLTSLELTITNLYELDERNFSDCMMRLGCKKSRPLWELRLKFSDVTVRPFNPHSYHHHTQSARGASSASASASPPPPPSFLHKNFMTVTNSIRFLSELRFLSIEGIGNTLDIDDCAWLSHPDRNHYQWPTTSHIDTNLSTGSESARPSPTTPVSSPSFPPGYSPPCGVACFPHLLRLSLPVTLGKTTQRIYQIRKFCPKLNELDWPDWSSAAMLEMMIQSVRGDKRQPMASPVINRMNEDDNNTLSSIQVTRFDPTIYLPPPLRLPPLSSLHSFHLDGSLREDHLKVLASFYPNSLKSLSVSNYRATKLPYQYLARFTGNIDSHSHPSSASIDDGSFASYGVESLSLSAFDWSFESLVALSQCGRWPKLKRLCLSFPSSVQTMSNSSCHNLSVANSAYHPQTFFQQLGVGNTNDTNTLEQLWLENLHFESLAVIAPPLINPNYAKLNSLTLTRVVMAPRTLMHLHQVGHSLKHLVLDRLPQFIVEDIAYLLDPAKHWKSSISPSSPVLAAVSSSSLSLSTNSNPKLELHSLHYCPESVSLKGSYLRQLAALPPNHPFHSHIALTETGNSWFSRSHGDDDLDNWCEMVLLKFARLAIRDRQPLAPNVDDGIEVFLRPAAIKVPSYITEWRRVCHQRRDSKTIIDEKESAPFTFVEPIGATEL